MISDNRYTHNAGFNTGGIYINGKWYAISSGTTDALPIISSENGEEWGVELIASSTIASELYSIKNENKSIFLAYGSNKYMFMSSLGEIVTSNGITENSSYCYHKYKVSDELSSNDFMDLGYANGRFLLRSVGGFVAL